jgi:hypothetical protein
VQTLIGLDFSLHYYHVKFDDDDAQIKGNLHLSSHHKKKYNYKEMITPGYQDFQEPDFIPKFHEQLTWSMSKTTTLFIIICSYTNKKLCQRPPHS